jgi:hypothetical protein
MATRTEATASHTFPRLHWGAVIGGVLLAVAVQVVLGLVGAALGFAAAPAGSRAMGVAAAIWEIVTPFVATLLGAWLACRMAAAEESRSASLHGVLVWCIGLIAGALFLTGTMATGNAGLAQRQLAAETGGARTPARAAQVGGVSASRAASATAGGGALAALAGLLGGFVGASIASRRRGGRFGIGLGAWRLERHEPARPGDRGGAGYGGTPGTPGTGLGPSEIPPTDPYRH